MSVNKLFIDIETIPAGDPSDHGTLKRGETEDEAYRKRALDSMKGEIICIGWAYGEDEPYAISSPKENHEGELLGLFDSIIHSLRGSYKQSFEWVGWNIKSFDLTWIWRKAIQYNLKSLRQSIIRDRFKGNVIDLMEMWASDFRDMRKQSDVAKFLGIPDLSNGIDGSQVYDLYKAGKIKEIAEYCKGDVITTREIYKRIYL